MTYQPTPRANAALVNKFPEAFTPVVCDAVMEAWGPHPGCREFMTEPDTWACDSQADVVYTVEEFDQDGSEVVRYFRCPEHHYRDGAPDYPYSKLLAVEWLPQPKT